MPPVKSAASSSAPASACLPPRVAVCEPDLLLRGFLEECLRRALFEPVTCPGMSSGEVRLVVADVPAPRRGGAARIAVLRRHFPRAKVLAISGQFMPGMSAATSWGAELGADAVLAKPFAAKIFIARVRALLAQ